MSATNPIIGLSFTETRKVFQALAFAARKHSDQRCRDVEASPCIDHPIALADLLVNEGCVTDHVVLCAALLHDTIEDTETSHDELVATFGREIADVVREVTDDTTLGKAERRSREIEHAPYLSARARLVKIVDKTCTLRDLASKPPPDWTAERRQAYCTWAARVVARLGCDNQALLAAFEAALVAGSVAPAPPPLLANDRR
ncbi:phosphohydrolase [Polymorphobacter multimanifer]|uniref:HD domain-containing protein n=1 Tax=Polymorphobacter multimanifer TaxID=1070431 RepID=UPI0019C9656F|nr:HD domain-containing protein [Polymorphobacter multimanifer]GGI73359.1 phosphohydrolase [Polymorphobacter multimanifer]